MALLHSVANGFMCLSVHLHVYIHAAQRLFLSAEQNFSLRTHVCKYMSHQQPAICYYDQLVYSTVRNFWIIGQHLIIPPLAAIAVSTILDALSIGQLKVADIPPHLADSELLVTFSTAELHWSRKLSTIFSLGMAVVSLAKNLSHQNLYSDSPTEQA